MNWLAECAADSPGCHDTFDLFTALVVFTPIALILGALVWLLRKGDPHIQFSFRRRRP